ncbi:MAG: RluA family pseudouridine synthase [Elusimicrobia bacterium]|nr:RluA family pseudouridine synthase [Elusimicrobiota bacterium]
MRRTDIDGDGWVEVPFEVPGDHAGARLDRYLAGRLRRYSRGEVQRLIDAGRVLLGRRPVKASTRLAEGERIVVRYPRREEPPPRHGALTILLEDERLVAVAKPGDLLSHPTDKVVRSAATSILREQLGLRLHLAHRLDRETSGVLLFAKDPATARALTGQFTRREIRKEYLALVRGRAPFRRRLVELPIAREGAEIKVRQAVAKDGQPAATELRVLRAGEKASLVLASPKTGRLHQIRVHLAALGLPILGDKLYTGNGAAYLKAVRRELTPLDSSELGAERQMLHAWRLRLTHPGTGRPLAIEAPPPGDLAACAAAHGIDAAASLPREPAR